MRSKRRPMTFQTASAGAATTNSVDRSDMRSASLVPDREAIPGKGIVGHRPVCETARHERRAGAATAGAG
jgi:hypothetical protein